MYELPIKYTDYNGIDREEIFMFNMTEAEIQEMNLSVNGGMAALMVQIANTRDTATLVKIFKDMILKAYGQKSTDGKRFIKTPELRDAFEQCPAYSELFMQLSTDNVAAAKFLKSILPKKIQNEIKMEDAQKEAEKQLSGPAVAQLLPNV